MDGHFSKYVRKSQAAIEMYKQIHAWLMQSNLHDIDKNIELSSLDHVHVYYELDDKIRKFQAIANRLGVNFTDG